MGTFGSPPGTPGRMLGDVAFSSPSVLLSGLELNDTNVYEP